MTRTGILSGAYECRVHYVEPRCREEFKLILFASIYILFEAFFDIP
jgi:hypothetical protein